MRPDIEVEVDPAESDRIDAILRELDAEDLEFLEPPTSIWKAISAKVDAERDAARIARTAPGSAIRMRSRSRTVSTLTTASSAWVVGLRS